MIKIVPDANLIITSLLGFNGFQRQLINLALEKKIVLYGSEDSYSEFSEVIRRDKFKKYLSRQLYSVEKLDFDYKSFLNIVDTDGVYEGVNIVKVDPDDDVYFKVAKACGSKIIVTNDNGVLDVGKYDDIRTLTAAKFIASYKKIN